MRKLIHIYYIYIMNTGRVYIIRSTCTSDVYIGSTEETLRIRLQKHESKFRSHLNEKHNYCTSYELICQDDYWIELLEEMQFDEDSELVAVEQLYINADPNCVNKNLSNNVAPRTLRYREYKRAYNLANRERISEYQRNWRSANKQS